MASLVSHPILRSCSARTVPRRLRAQQLLSPRARRKAARPQESRQARACCHNRNRLLQHRSHVQCKHECGVKTSKILQRANAIASQMQTSSYMPGRHCTMCAIAPTRLGLLCLRMRARGEPWIEFVHQLWQNSNRPILFLMTYRHGMYRAPSCTPPH
jgi:hypothetical protein